MVHKHHSINGVSLSPPTHLLLLEHRDPKVYLVHWQKLLASEVGELLMRRGGGLDRGNLLDFNHCSFLGQDMVVDGERFPLNLHLPAPKHPRLVNWYSKFLGIRDGNLRYMSSLIKECLGAGFFPVLWGQKVVDDWVSSPTDSRVFKIAGKVQRRFVK